MAEFVTRALLEEAGLAERVTVSSTGTGDWHIGNPANSGAVRALADRGYDASHHRARQLTAELLGDYDLLVGLDSANISDIQRMVARLRAAGSSVARPADPPDVALLRDFAADGVPGQSVPDPYGQDAPAFEHTLDLVEQACRGLVAHLEERLRRSN